MVFASADSVPLHGFATDAPSFARRDLPRPVPLLTALSPLAGPLKVIFGFGAAAQNKVITLPDDLHLGVEIAAELGTPVTAVMDGTVGMVGHNEDTGNFIVIKHPGGVWTVYGHLARVAVPSGMVVARGATIAHSGITGLVTEPALHFGIVKDGTTFFDPQSMLRK